MLRQQNPNFMNIAEPIESCYLLSFPRSGNHWARYLIEWLMGYPTSPEMAHLGSMQLLGHYDSPIYSRCEMADLSGKPYIAYKRHCIYDYDDRTIPLLFILRPYEEAVTRHLYISGVVDLSISNPDVTKQLDFWADLLLEYHNWPAKKELIYYTNLVDNPVISIGVILKFFGREIDERVNDFMKHLDYHRKNAFSTVAAVDNTSFDGEKWQLSKHGLNLTDKQKEDWANYLSSRIGHLNIPLP
jgi:hypothetical protein